CGGGQPRGALVRPGLPCRSQPCLELRRVRRERAGAELDRVTRGEQEVVRGRAGFVEVLTEQVQSDPEIVTTDGGVHLRPQELDQLFPGMRAMAVESQVDEERRHPGPAKRRDLPPALCDSRSAQKLDPPPHVHVSLAQTGSRPRACPRPREWRDEPVLNSVAHSPPPAAVPVWIDHFPPGVTSTVAFLHPFP